MRISYPAEVKQEAMDRLRAGISQRAVSLKMHIARVTLRSWAFKAGLELPGRKSGRPIDAELKREVQELAQRMPRQQVVKLMAGRVTPVTVYRWTRPPEKRKVGPDNPARTRALELLQQGNSGASTAQLLHAEGLSAHLWSIYRWARREGVPLPKRRGRKREWSDEQELLIARILLEQGPHRGLPYLLRTKGLLVSRTSAYAALERALLRPDHPFLEPLRGRTVTAKEAAELLGYRAKWTKEMLRRAALQGRAVRLEEGRYTVLEARAKEDACLR